MKEQAMGLQFQVALSSGLSSCQQTVLVGFRKRQGSTGTGLGSCIFGCSLRPISMATCWTRQTLG